MSDEGLRYPRNPLLMDFELERVDIDWYEAKLQFTRQGVDKLAAFLTMLGVPKADITQALSDVGIRSYDD